MKITDLKNGDCVCTDAGFTCLRSGLHNVKEDERGLFIHCDDGKHYLNGQENEAGQLVGLTPPPV